MADISNEKRKFLESIGIDVNNLPPEFNRHSDDIRDTFTREEIDFLERESLTGRYQKRFCLKDLIGTVHPDYEDRTWFEAFLKSKRGDSIVEEYFRNPEYYSRDLKQFDQSSTRQETPLELLECDGKFFINGGNNRLSLIMMKYLAELSRAQTEEERAKIDELYTFVADVQPIPEDKGIMHLINIIRDFGNKDIEVRRTAEKASECKYEIKVNGQRIQINSKEDLEDYVKNRYNINNSQSIEQLKEGLANLISDGIMYENDADKTRILNSLFMNFESFRKNYIKIRGLGMEQHLFEEVDIKNINYDKLSAKAASLVKQEEARKEEEKKQKEKDEQEAKIKKEREAKEKLNKQIKVTLKKDEIRNKGQNIPNRLEITYYQLKEEEIRYRGLAKKLGLSYTQAKIDDMNIQSSINLIKSNIQSIINQVQKVDDLEKLDKVIGVFSELEYLAQDGTITIEYTQMLKENFTKRFDTRVQNLIKKSKISKLEMERAQIESEKITIIGRILGKERLKQAKLENIDIRKKLMMFEEKEDKLEYSIEDSLSELYAYSQCELDKKLTPEMQEFLKEVERDVQLKQMIDEKRLKEYIEQKLSERQIGRQLVPSENSKLSNRQRANTIQNQNNDMNRQIQSNRIRNLTKQNSFESITMNKTAAVVKFHSIVDEIRNSTQIRDNEEQQKSEPTSQIRL